MNSEKNISIVTASMQQASAAKSFPSQLVCPNVIRTWIHYDFVVEMNGTLPGYNLLGTKSDFKKR